MSHHPTDGVRLLLELKETDPARGARYTGAVFTPMTRTDFDVRIDAAAAVTITSVGEVQAEGPGDRGRDMLRAIARTIAKKAIEEHPAAWPRRILRWRRG